MSGKKDPREQDPLDPENDLFWDPDLLRQPPPPPPSPRIVLIIAFVGYTKGGKQSQRCSHANFTAVMPRVGDCSSNVVEQFPTVGAMSTL